MVVIDVIKIEDDEEDVKPESPQYPLCPKHPGQAATKVCQDPKCGSSMMANLVCTLCICSGVHLNHRLIDVEEEYGKCLERLKCRKKGLEQAKEQLVKNVETLNRFRAIKNKTSKRKRKMIEEHFQQAKAQLDELHKAAIEQLDSAHDKFSTELLDKQNEQHTSLAELRAKSAHLDRLMEMSPIEFFAEQPQSIQYTHSVARLIEPKFICPTARLCSISTFTTNYKCVYFADPPTFPKTLKNFFAAQEKFRDLIKYKGQLLKPLSAESSKSTEHGTLIIVLDAQYLHPPARHGSIGEMARLRRIFSNKRYDKVRIGLVSPIYAVNFIGEIDNFVQRHAHVKMEYIVKDEPVSKIAFEQFVDNCLA